jgi:N-acetylgalactosamine kinase
VVANSLVEQHKQRSAATHFNRRVVECRLACALLARALGVPWPASGMPLGALQERLSCDAEGMAALARSTLTRDSYSMEDLRAHLGAPPESFLAGIATAPAVLAALAAPDAAGLRLRQRAEHVFSEAHRVERFVAACARPGPAQTRLLGALLNDSHRSCALGFECSCEELDALQAACLRAGALGARLTGAGWGGCVISLVPEERLEAFVAALRASFYAQKDDSLVQSALFITKPCAGASVER